MKMPNVPSVEVIWICTYVRRGVKKGQFMYEFLSFERHGGSFNGIMCTLSNCYTNQHKTTQYTIYHILDWKLIFFLR